MNSVSSTLITIEMLIDYRTLVLEEYKRKRNAGELSPRLTHPTPGNLRAECVELCASRFSRKDQIILRTFFGGKEDQKAYIQAIERFEVDRFRPLLKYIKELVKDTEVKNIELLAWLIDFEPRPYDALKKYDNIDQDKKDGTKSHPKQKSATNAQDKQQNEGNDIVNIGINNEKVLFANMERGKSKSRFIIILGIIAILFIVALYGLWANKNLFGPMQTQGGCMYWTGDHYQPIPCNEKIENTLVVALDTVKVKYFKKITLPDTITQKSKGFVWYSKINNKVEFYTAGGYHPVEIRHRLKPVSEYIIDKYIHRRMTSQ